MNEYPQLSQGTHTRQDSFSEHATEFCFGQQLNGIGRFSIGYCYSAENIIKQGREARKCKCLLQHQICRLVGSEIHFVS